MYHSHLKLQLFGKEIMIKTSLYIYIYNLLISFFYIFIYISM